MTRWNRRLLLGAMVVLVPVLAGCEAGLNAPTLEYHPASVGTTVTQNGIRIDNAFVLGASPGSSLPPGGRAGVFLSIEAQNGDRLVSASAPGIASSVQLTGGSVDLPAQSLVDLSGPVPKVVLTGLSSPISGGDTVDVSFTFAQAGTIALTVPVEPNAYDYTTFSPAPSAGSSATAKPKPTKTVPPSPGASGTASNSVGGATGSTTPTP